MNNKLTVKVKQKVDKTALIHSMIRTTKTTDDLMPWGKHLFVQKYIASMLALGDRAWIIDIGCSYEKFCKLLKGDFIEFKPKNQISLNPFTFITNLNESMSMLKLLIAAMAAPINITSEAELFFIEQAIKAAWRNYGDDATITTVCTWLNTQENFRCKNLGHLLHPFSRDGIYGKYFDGACTINIFDPLVVIDLQELTAKEDLQKVISLALIYQISEVMRLGSRSQYKTCIIDDEVWNLLDTKNKGVASFIEAGCGTVDKHNANFVTVGQLINEAAKSKTL